MKNRSHIKVREHKNKRACEPINDKNLIPNCELGNHVIKRGHNDHKHI